MLLLLPFSVEETEVQKGLINFPKTIELENGEAGILFEVFRHQSHAHVNKDEKRAAHLSPDRIEFFAHASNKQFGKGY